MDLVRITGIALVAAALGACGADALPKAEPTPSVKSWTEDDWTIETPDGWVREDITRDADASKAIRYRATDGSYVIVAIDPLGSGYAYDALWTYEPAGRRFTIVEREDCEGKDCPTDDGRFDGYALWKTGTSPEKVRGHVWTFQFGDADGTTIDPAMFQDIIESVRAA